MQIIDKERSAFTLIEIVVTATILVILTSIGFYSFTQNISDARDSARITDISALWSQLSLYKRERGAYPFPGNRFNITNGTALVAFQGKMNNQVSLTTASWNLPVDPELKVPYFYSTTRNRQEYQIAGTIENSDDNYTILKWSYSSVSKNVLPNIILALETSSDTNIALASNKSLFLFDTWFNTLPYDFESGSPFSDGSTLTGMLNTVWEDYWQNIDYRNCSEIDLAWKNITATGQNDQYQILDTNGTLQDTTCSWTL